MSTEITTLDNGLRVVSHAMPHLETISLGVWVAAGARHERSHEHGISHLLEHMAFKGTRQRTARAIAEDIEQVGGELNAATSLEMTAYYARVLRGDEAVALEILADILQRSTYAAAELEREREVILQEIAAINDSPDELAYDLLQDAAFPGQAVGRPVIGTPASVKSFSGDDLRGFLGRHYVAPRTVLAAAGAIRHDDLVGHARALFGTLNAEAELELEASRYAGGVRSSARTFEQCHLLVGLESPSYRSDDYLTAQVLSGLLGGGMSSRLFQEVRESRGLCYAIYSSAWGLSDGGLFSVHAATGADEMDELIGVVAGEMARIAAERPHEAEVNRAKAQLKAGLLMSLESSGARAEQMARQLVAYGRLVSPAELIGRVDAVTPEAVRACAERMMAGRSPSVVVVGAGERSGAWAGAASRRIAA